MASVIINGEKIAAQEGQMLIDVADSAGISIPRFCYHPKLSVAANCRMCLVEVQGGRKPVPACATPITDGMVVNTQSENTKAAQKSVMEFLLINHPLDCPICDQGGECELQDVSMEYGSDLSRHSVAKRVVADKDIGPLVNTDLTRCIHCTRCVRFGKEIAGVQELGMTGRSEFSEIGTFVEKSMDSELSGNVIDLCPVGALTSKPFRYSARAWELVCRDGIGGHDSTGSNLLYHIKGNVLKRVTPKQNENINEVWLSDRDRFSYEGIQCDQRYSEPKVRKNVVLEAMDWSIALDKAAAYLKDQKPDVLISQHSTLEEMSLLQQLNEHLGGCLDSRLKQRDFEGSAKAFLNDAIRPIHSFEQVDHALVVGSNLTEEHPMIAHRLRKTGCQLKLLNAKHYHLRIKAVETQLLRPALWAEQLANLLKAVLQEKKDSETVAQWPALNDLEPNEQTQQWAKSLLLAQEGVILVGSIAAQSHHFAQILEWGQLLAEHSGAQLMVLPEHANSVGAKIARLDATCSDGNVHQMIQHRMGEPLILFNVDPDQDTAYGRALIERMKRSKVIAFATHHSKSLNEYADVILPIATYVESSGTFVNASGEWQSFAAAVPAQGEAKAGWRVLRVLSNLLEVPHCQYQSSTDIRDELKQTPNPALNAIQAPSGLKTVGSSPERIVFWHAYAGDPIVRNAEALQQTEVAKSGSCAHVSAKTLEKLSLTHRKDLTSMERFETLCQVSDEVAEDCYWLPVNEESLLEEV